MEVINWKDDWKFDVAIHEMSPISLKEMSVCLHFVLTDPVVLKSSLGQLHSFDLIKSFTVNNSNKLYN